MNHGTPHATPRGVEFRENSLGVVEDICLNTHARLQKEQRVVTCNRHVLLPI